MASSSQSSPQRPSTSTSIDHEMASSEELLEIGAKSLQTGAVTGAMGIVFGAGAGIIRGAPPALFALVAGLQWFSLGSSYIASRNILWHAWGGEENLSRSDFVKASGIAGGVSGMVGGMFRGPRNIIPGILVFSALGAGGSYMTQRPSGKEEAPKPKTSWLDSKWSPMKRLTDKEYEEKLEEKILRLEAEIAIVDENIESLRASAAPKDNTTAAERSDQTER